MADAFPNGVCWETGPFFYPDLLGVLQRLQKAMLCCIPAAPPPTIGYANRSAHTAWAFCNPVWVLAVPPANPPSRGQSLWMAAMG